MEIEEYELKDSPEEFEISGNIVEYSAEKQFLQKFDRILSEDMAINVQNTQQNIGSADMKNKIINLNFQECFKQNNNEYPDFIKSLKGLNHHELGHLMWTSKPVGYRYGFDSSLKKILFNILEDCRIENLFTEKFPITEPYFNWNISLFIVKNQPESNIPIEMLKSMTLNYLLTFGRKFFDRNYVSSLRANLLTAIAINGTYDLQEVERLEDEFILTNNFEKQKSIVSELYLILKDIIDYGCLNNIRNDTIGIKLEKNSSLTGNTTREKKADKMKEQIKKKSEQFLEDVKEKSKEKLPSANEKSVKDAKEELLKNIMDVQIKISEDVKSEINEDIADIISIKSCGNGELERISEPIQITNEDRLMSKRIKNLIMKLRNDLGQHYVRKQKNGMINIRDYIQTSNNAIPDMDIFRKFKHSKLNKSKLGVVILLDSSGSMSDSEYKIALRSAYCISNSLEATNSKVEVIAFANAVYQIVKPFNKSSNSIKWKRMLYGGTEPEQSMMFSDKELVMIKKRENIKNLMFILISDLYFPTNNVGENSIENIMKRLSKKSTITIFQIADKYNQIHTSFSGTIKKIQSLSNYFYKIHSFDELYDRMNDFIRKFQTKLHLDIQRGRI